MAPNRGIPQDLLHGEAPLTQAGTNPPRTIDFLPYVFPPDTAIPFDVVDVQTLNLGTNATIPIILAQSASYAVLRWFANETPIPAGYVDIQWTIMVGGFAYNPYINMQYSRGSIDNPDPFVIRVPPNRAVDVVIVNTSAISNWEVRTRVKGWYY